MTKYHIVTSTVEDFLEEYDGPPFHGCFCDPPYGLEFMGKQWDHGVPGEPIWRSVLECLLPGAHVLAFGGTRTHHRLMVAIEDAGFEIRDTLMWLYGQGFPKSHAVGKAIDRELGAEREVIGSRISAYGTETATGDRVSRSDGGAGLWAGSEPKEVPLKGGPATPESRTFEGYGTALKPSWEPLVLAMKSVDGTYAENALRHGVAGLNIDDTRIAANGEKIDAAYPGPGEMHEGWKRPWMEDQEKWDQYKQRALDKANQQGRWPANTILSHSPGCHKRGVRKVRNRSGSVNGDEPSAPAKHAYGEYSRIGFTRHGDDDGYEAVAAWDCVPECAVRMLAEQSGESGGDNRTQYTVQTRTNGTFETGFKKLKGAIYGDTGTAARFFYTPKASSFERSAGLPEDLENDHPTIKPLSICTYLATLLLPPPQDKPRRLLIPFSGAGSEATGAALAGWDEIVCVEMEPHYVEIAEHRLAYWLEMAERAGTTDIDALFEYAKGVEKAKRERQEKIETGQMTLF